MSPQRDDEFPTHADADAERPVDEELTDDDGDVVDGVPDDVDPADWVDQHRTVPIDDDHDA